MLFSLVSQAITKSSRYTRSSSVVIGWTCKCTQCCFVLIVNHCRGANWIHGITRNPITKFASATGTKLVLHEPESIVYDANGYKLPRNVVDKCEELIEDAMEGAEEYSKQYSDTINAKTSVMDFIMQEIQSACLDDESRVICEQMAHMHNDEFADPIASQSLKHLYLQDGADGAEAFVASTHKRIVQMIAQLATNAGAIQLNHRVTNICSTFRESGQREVVVTTASGKTQSFDEVVVTCPLGWLKHNKTIFSPSLPAPMAEAIDNIGYGALEKVFVKFPAAFWERKGAQPASRGGAVRGRKKSRDGYSFWHFLCPEYHPLTKKIGPWTQMVFSLSGLPGDDAHPTLLFYLSPPCSRSFIPTLKNVTPHTATYDELLRAFAEPFYSRLPNYDARQVNCHPVAFLATQWQNDAMAGYGSYSNVRVTQVDAKADFDLIRSGGGQGESGNNLMGCDRGVWFAGEHTTPPFGIGTTTGAWASGNRAARDIIEAYRVKQGSRAL